MSLPTSRRGEPVAGRNRCRGLLATVPFPPAIALDYPTEYSSFASLSPRSLPNAPSDRHGLRYIVPQPFSMWIPLHLASSAERECCTANCRDAVPNPDTHPLDFPSEDNTPEWDRVLPPSYLIANQSHVPTDGLWASPASWQKG